MRLIDKTISLRRIVRVGQTTTDYAHSDYLLAMCKVAAEALDKAGVHEAATAVRSFQFRDLRAKADTDKADAS